MELARKRRIAKVAAGLLLVLATVAALIVGRQVYSDGEKCGVERWAVKTGTDDDVWWVDLVDDWPTSIEEMRSWPKPNTLPAYNRIDP